MARKRITKDHLPTPHEFLSFGVFILITVSLFFLFTVAYPSVVLKRLALQEAQNQSLPSFVEDVPDETQSRPRDAVEALVPFVRGMISGVKGGVLQSTAPEKPLAINKVKGYQLGAKTAVLTSLNWYDLDRELFSASGLLIGVRNAVATSKVNPLQFQLGYQLQLIDSIRTALSVSIEDLLGSSQSRGLSFTAYVNQLKVLRDQAEIELAQLQMALSTYQADWQTALNQQAAASESFKQNVRDIMVSELDQNIADFSSAGSEAAKMRAQYNANLTMFKNLQPLAARLPLVISALEANSAALIQGIKVKPTPGVNLPIYQE